MASFSDLIDVRFEERVSYPNTDGVDVMGIVLPYFWGPVDQLRVYDRSGFFEAYPESLPYENSIEEASKEFFFAYAQVKKFFENGGVYVIGLGGYDGTNAGVVEDGTEKAIFPTHEDGSPSAPLCTDSNYSISVKNLVAAIKNLNQA